MSLLLKRDDAFYISCNKISIYLCIVHVLAREIKAKNSLEFPLFYFQLKYWLIFSHIESNHVCDIFFYFTERQVRENSCLRFARKINRDVFVWEDCTQSFRTLCDNGKTKSVFVIK